MVLYLIGLGLGSKEDITVRGLNAVRNCDKVYLESYTSILSYGCGYDKDELEAFYGREVLEADRGFVEEGCDEMIAAAKISDIGLLVVGDPFGATTHSDLAIRAMKDGVKVEVIHNTSILNAVGCCGLQLYSFGEVVSIVMWSDTCKVESFYDKIAQNRDRGLHTLCLLDIKVKEQSVENLIRGRKVFEPPCFLTCNQAASQLLHIVKGRRDRGDAIAFNEATKVVGLARVGWPSQKELVDDMTVYAYFGMQCFWGESAFAKLSGVLNTRVGYTGGTGSNPTYRDIKDHTETIEVDFDPEEISYNELLDFFFSHHDPAVQRKTQYRSVIFYIDAEQKKVAENALENVLKSKPSAETKVEKLGTFYQAEDYHQKYWLRSQTAIFGQLKLNDELIANSFLATKLNAFLAGYTNFGLLEKLADDNSLNKDLVESIRKIASTGGDPRACH